MNDAGKEALSFKEKVGHSPLCAWNCNWITPSQLKQYLMYCLTWVSCSSCWCRKNMEVIGIRIEICLSEGFRRHLIRHDGHIYSVNLNKLCSYPCHVKKWPMIKRRSTRELKGLSGREQNHHQPEPSVNAADVFFCCYEAVKCVCAEDVLRCVSRSVSSRTEQFIHEPEQRVTADRVTTWNS